MKAAFRLTLALAATWMASGCRTAGLSPSARPRPALTPEPKLTFRLDEFIDEHNRNAERIESLKSKASITGTMAAPDTGEPMTAAVSGHLAILRPRNFQLKLYRLQSTVADIGSNEDRFWFWIQGDSKVPAEEKHVYYCDYADLPKADLAGTFQPDWMVDALGLKPIRPDEAGLVRVSPGIKPKTTKLTFPATGEGSSFAREMLVSDESRRLVEYRVFDRDGKTLIGQATIKEYSNIELEADDDKAAESAEPPTCYIPNRFLLEWKREKLSLDILLKDVAVNQTFSAKMKANFVEPKPSGYSPMDLAVATRKSSRSQGEATAVRETLPAPEPRGRGRTSPPVEIHGAEPPGLDPGSRNISTPVRAGAPPRRPEPKPAAALEPVLMPVLEDVVGAATPRAPGPPYQTAGADGVFGLSPTLER